MKKAITLLLCTFLLAASMAGCGSTGNDGAAGSGSQADRQDTSNDEDTDAGSASADDAESGSDASGANGKEDPADLLDGLHHIEIEISGYGVIALELDADTAPVSVTNFISLAREGFYDGLTFHRIIDGFMIQGGDPLGNGTGGSETTIKGEFSSNGVKNGISHKRGVISMARSRNPDSASSQFFIVHKDSTFLDGEYAAFGHVTEGIEIVDAICKDTAVQDDDGTVASADQPVIKAIRVID